MIAMYRYISSLAEAVIPFLLMVLQILLLHQDGINFMLRHQAYYLTLVKIIFKEVIFIHGDFT